MIIERIHTEAGQDPLKRARFRTRRGEDWMEYAVPAAWGSAAVDVLLAKIFYRGPLPAMTRPVPEDGVPAWLWRQVADAAGLEAVSAEWRYRFERDSRDVFNRIAGGLAYHGWKAGIFTAEEDARAFHDEFRFLLLHQKAAPETALLASAGLDWAYGLGGAEKSEQALFRPAAAVAAFAEDLPVAGLPGAGVVVPRDFPARHLLRRLKILGERLALQGEEGKITVTLPVENSDSPAFAELRRRADIDAVARELGVKTLEEAMHRVMDACDRDSARGFLPQANTGLDSALREARRAGISEPALRQALGYAEQGFESVALAPPADEEPPLPLFTTLAVTDDFIERALTGHSFLLREAGEDKTHAPAEKLWNRAVEAIWASGEPALFFADSAPSLGTPEEAAGYGPSGKGGLLFFSGTEAPAAVINLPGFAGAAARAAGEPGPFVDSAALVQAVKIMTVALEASFGFAGVSEKTRAWRPLSLGFTGLAALLMGNALPYDSDAGRNAAGLVSAIISGAAHAASAALAAPGAFRHYPALEKQALQAVKDKMSAVSGTAYMQNGLTRRPVQLKAKQCADTGLVAAVGAVWEEAYAKGRENGFRHAHLTAVDTGLPLQCLLGAQTRDLAPETGVTRFEGYFSDAGDQAELYGKKLNPMVPRALTALGYGPFERDDIYFYVIGHGTLLDAPFVNHKSLKGKGFPQAALDALEAALKTAQHIRYAFNKWTLGEDFCARVLGFKGEDLVCGTFDMLSALGFTEDQIDAANLYCCGAMTLEGAPHLKVQHLAVFDCLSPPAFGVRRVSPEAQIKMQAALEPFLSGAAMHTVELPHHATIEDVNRLALLAWELGVRRLHLYRDGCSLLHPLAGEVGSKLAEETSAAEEQTPLRFEAPRLKKGAAAG